MAQDYKTRLTADTSQHDQALKRSAQQVYQYKQKAEETDKSMGQLVGKLGKFVKVLAVAKVAGEGFNSIMRNNQTAADNYGQTMEVAKRISDEFFYAVSKADFSNFINGMYSCISAASEYYKALDNLQTLQLGLIGENARLDKEMQNARLRVRQGDASAVADIQRISDEMLANVRKEQASIKKTLEKMIKSAAIGTGKSGDYRVTYDRGFDVEEVQRWLSHQSELEIEITRAKSEVDDLMRRASEYNDMNGIHSQAAQAEARYKALVALRDKMSDGENLQAFEQQYAKMQQLEAQYSQMEQRNLRYTKELGADNEPKTPTFKAPKVKVQTEIEPPPEGSIAELEAKLSELGKSYKLATTDEQRNALREQMEALQAELDRMNGKKVEVAVTPVIPEGSIAYLQQQIRELTTQMENTPDAEIRIKLQADIADLQNQLKELQTTDAERAAEALKKKYAELQAQVNATASAFSSFGSIFSSLGDCMEDEGKRFMQVMATVFNGISTLIPQIAALTASEEAEAMASGTASAAKLPFPYNLASIASVVATLMGVFASISSIAKGGFADGGIFSGKTTIGDYNLARVNAGEMILNNRQQQHLFNLLNGNTQVNARTDGGNVTFTIHGSDLQGTLANYNKRRNRVM